MDGRAGLYQATEERPRTVIDGHEIPCFMDVCLLAFVNSAASQPVFDVVDLMFVRLRASTYFGITF